MPAKPASVAEYLDALSAERRARFESLRATVRAAAPAAEETIAYDMPAYRLRGRFMCSIGAYARHDSLFPASEGIETELAGEVDRYLAGKGTIQFPASEPLPLDLIRRIVEIRVREHRARD